MVFLDGVGIGSDDPAVNPIARGHSPCLRSLIAERAMPLDATLGVPGIPQSATGQTALLTGQNAAREAGRHIEGFPGPLLRAIISRHNIFARLRAMGISSTFANAYFISPDADVNSMRPKSVTTVASLSAFGDVRRRSELESNQAVYHDITRERLLPRGYAGPLISPETGASHLAAIAAGHRFTLFEYFLTDMAGHSRDPNLAAGVLSTLDAFLAALVRYAEQGRFILILVSDHGNIEDSSTQSHTLNPVPFVQVGAPGGPPPSQPDLTGVVPGMLNLLGVA